MKRAATEFKKYRENLGPAANNYSDRITSLRKDITRLAQLYRNMQQSVDQKTLTPHKALDRIPKMDKLKEAYLRLNELAEFLENKAISDSIFEYVNFPSSHIMEGTSKYQEFSNLASKKTFDQIHEISLGEEKLADLGPNHGQTLIDLNVIAQESTQTIHESLIVGNKHLINENEFKQMTKTLKQITFSRRERAENLKNLHKKFLDYISKVPYSSIS